MGFFPFLGSVLDVPGSGIITISGLGSGLESFFARELPINCNEIDRTILASYIGYPSALKASLNHFLSLPSPPELNTRRKTVLIHPWEWLFTFCRVGGKPVARQTKKSVVLAGVQIADRLHCIVLDLTCAHESRTDACQWHDATIYSMHATISYMMCQTCLL